VSRPFTHLHTHGEYSNFDGFGKQRAFLQRAKEQGCDAIAMTEHGSLRGITKLQEEAEEIGIRPIYGVEFYLADDISKKGLTAEEKVEVTASVPVGERKEAIYQAEVARGHRERFHLTVLAENQVGLRNLFRLTSIGWLKGFYKRPRIDMASLTEHNEGLIVLTGCSSGAIASEVLAGNIPAAVARAEQLHGLFGDRLYAEIMAHGLDFQVEVNKAIRIVAEAFGIPIVATQDAHYVDPDGWKYQEAMLCIHTRSESG